MDEDLRQPFGCQSLFCEELDIKGSQETKKTCEEEVLKDEEDGEKEDEDSQGAPQEEEGDEKVKVDHESPEQKKSRKTRMKKPDEHPENIKEQKDVVEDKPEAVPTSPEENSALTEPPVGLMSTCDLSEPVYLGSGGSGLCAPPASAPVVQLSQNPGPVQPAPTKRPQTVSQHGLEPLEMEITQVYATRRSIRYGTRGRGQALNFPQLPEPENAEGCLVPPPPKKKTRTLYSTNQLEHLEALFQEDHYPDGEKRKVIAASVGVTPQRIMVWFQNRRAKWRKAERLVSGKPDQWDNRARWSPSHPQTIPTVPNMAATASSKVLPVFSGHLGANIPTPVPPVPPFSALSTSTLPSFSQMLTTSPGQPRVREPQPPDFHPRPMRSPPPVRRASLPLLAAPYNLNTPTPTPPLFVDERDGHPLQTDASSLFDFGDKLDYHASGHQSNAQLSFQLPTSYPPGHPPPQQLQTSTSMPTRMAFITPSPYLTPNPDTIPTPYFTFGHAGNSAGGPTYAQGGGPILLQPTNHGGMASYQSYHWPNMYAQPSVRQLAPNYPAGFSASAARDHQIPSSSGSMPPCFQRAYAHGGPAALPPVSTLQPSRLRAESGTAAKGAAVAPLLPSQASPGSFRGPLPPSCVKIEYDSPQVIHSHFHTDFSPIQF